MKLNRMTKTSFSLVAAAFAAPLVLSSVAAADDVTVKPGTGSSGALCVNGNGQVRIKGADCSTGPSQVVERLVINGDDQILIGEDAIETRDNSTGGLPGKGRSFRLDAKTGTIQTFDTSDKSETFSVDGQTGNTETQGTLTVQDQTTTNGITNTGDITTDTQQVNGTLQVDGQTTTAGINNRDGGITNAGDVSGVDSLTTDNNSTVTIGSNSTIDMGDNVVGGVADPLMATDAANKRYVDQEINKAFDAIEDNTEGIALAMAMSGLVLPTNAQFAVGVNFGFYDDKQAIAAQGALRLDETFTVIGGFGAGLNDSENVGGRIGVQASF